ncbi:ATP-binding cassette domain-containing protein [Actinocrinis puniceicyclus]|uniref:ATP-binding cassette domain-containing protein n=1 Tax=Actinocrinis puniceicyclus TaxID=977794 RepID=A0A8J8B9V9_9ACTN|nr:ATP-binding cassette domain-containing protein [Actinocrinis puniceicyclus]MBS2962242.1 ATP-binding cassette domain-containing protein [Actinocrinis puniceicyclus]
MSGAIAVTGMTKRYKAVTAVDDLSFVVEPGVVTGFLGPNGAGKTTTLRVILGLVAPSAGRALIEGRRYAELAHPRRVVGAVLETGGFHSGRRGRDHLRILARSGGIAGSRVDEVLERVGLTESAHRRVGGYSLGMRQRLGLAGALLGDPGVLVLDEPANGLDPAGMAQLRDLLRGLAGEGRTVLVSSHVLSEVAQTVDRVVIVSGGALRYAGTLKELTGARGETLEAAFLRLTSNPTTTPRAGAATARTRG